MAAFLPTEETPFEQSLLKAAPRVRSLLGRQTLDGNEADDVLQDALARALTYRGSFDPGRGSLVAWLSRVAQRVLMERRASRGRAPAALAFEPAEEEQAEGLTSEEVASAMEQLGELERVVLQRFHGAGESIAELSRALRMPVGTVKSHLHRGRQRLGQELRKLGYGPVISERKDGDQEQ